MGEKIKMYFQCFSVNLFFELCCLYYLSTAISSFSLFYYLSLIDLMVTPVKFRMSLSLAFSFLLLRPLDDFCVLGTKMCGGLFKQLIIAPLSILRLVQFDSLKNH